MPQVEAPAAPAVDVAAFFSSPPVDPASLVAARAKYFASGAVAAKFEAAAREARESGVKPAAALGSWVTGDYARALELATGRDELSRFLRGTSLLEAGDPAGALLELQGSAAGRDAAMASAELHALSALLRFADLEKLLPNAPLSEPDRLYFQGRLLESKADHAGAVASYEAALARDPEHRASRFRIAFRADLMGDDERALAEYEKLAAFRPVSAAVLINLGVMYEDRNMYERACGCYGAVLRRDPANGLARLFYADAHDSLDMYYDESLELKEDQLRKVLRTPITDFELSVRARNCLANMNIRTLGDLVSHTELDLMGFKNFGETSLNEIKRLLANRGLKLGMRRDDGSFVIPEDFNAGRTMDLASELAWLGELTEEQKEALDLQISSLSLSVRCHRVLVERLNLQRVGDVLLYTEEDLLSMPNFGITSLNELKVKLTEYGLRLRSGRGDELEEEYLADEFGEDDEDDEEGEGMEPRAEGETAVGNTEA
jgi:DNA-directed RNA polymerase subunit alpha